MKKAKRNNILLVAILLALIPALSFAQTTAASDGSTQTTAQTNPIPQGLTGIFSCNQNGANAMSVGALGATGGVYVPVADATVELNTGTLVYKECILREVVDAQRIAATAGFAGQSVNQIQTSRGGSPQYVVNEGTELTNVATAAVQGALQGLSSGLDPSIQQQVKQAVAQTYVNSTYNPSSALTCGYQNATSDFTSSNPQGNTFNDVLAVASPCNPLFGYYAAQDIVLGTAAQEQQCQKDQWQWGGGFYAVTSGSGGPCENKISTPSSLVNSAFTQVITSPFNQLQNANDLGQMVGALFAGLSTQITSSTGGGLAGITQPIGSSPSYLQQAIAQTTQNLSGAISNAALANLNAALTLEQGYFSIMTSIAGTLTQSAAQLQNAENQCWQQIVPAVRTQAQTDGVSLSTAKIQASTSSQEFSQAIISNQITATGNIVRQNLATSQQALNLINNLIQSVTGTSPDSQANAIAQLNQLINNNQLHTQPQVNAAQQQQAAIQQSMQTLVQNTVQFWAGTNPNDSTQTNIPWNGSINPGTGWCNFQNQTTLQLWEQKWKI